MNVSQFNLIDNNVQHDSSSLHSPPALGESTHNPLTKPHSPLSRMGDALLVSNDNVASLTDPRSTSSVDGMITEQAKRIIASILDGASSFRGGETLDHSVSALSKNASFIREESFLPSGDETLRDLWFLLCRNMSSLWEMRL